MEHFKTPTSNGVLETFVTMGVIYFMFMMIGVYSVRVPAEGWKPAGWVAPAKPETLVTRANVAVNVAWKTPQFWLLWVVLCMNVTAGIGVLGQASPMIQEIFSGRVTASAAAGFVGLLSLFNMGGRFVWASVSDYIGRKNTYLVFFGLGILLYSAVPTLGHLGSIPLFVAAFAVILSMYGGGFATVPAYLRDIFGTMHVGAIHGRLLTAWSVAGVLGPVLVNYIRQYQIESGVPKAQAYSVTMYIMCALLLVGLLCNLAMRPVARSISLPPGNTRFLEVDVMKARFIFLWLSVTVPLLWGVMKTLQNALKLFQIVCGDKRKQHKENVHESAPEPQHRSDHRPHRRHSDIDRPATAQFHRRDLFDHHRPLGSVRQRRFVSHALVRGSAQQPRRSGNAAQPLGGGRTAARGRRTAARDRAAAHAAQPFGDAAQARGGTAQL